MGRKVKRVWKVKGKRGRRPPQPKAPTQGVQMVLVVDEGDLSTVKIVSLEDLRKGLQEQAKGGHPLLSK